MNVKLTLLLSAVTDCKNLLQHFLTHLTPWILFMQCMPFSLQQIHVLHVLLYFQFRMIFFCQQQQEQNSTLLQAAAPKPKNNNNTSVKCNLAWSLHFILHWRGTFYHHLALIVIRFWTTAAKYCTNYTTFDTEVKTIETNYCTNIYNNISLDIFGPQWKHWKPGCWQRFSTHFRY